MGLNDAYAISIILNIKSMMKKTDNSIGEIQLLQTLWAIGATLYTVII